MDHPWFRHLLATIAHRFTSTTKDTAPHYPTFDAGNGVRTPLEIVNHMSKVLNMALRAYEPDIVVEVELLTWEEERDRFYTILEKLDQTFIENRVPQGMTTDQILQGPLSDVLTHIGQLLTLRRLADNPYAGESYIKADVQAGHMRQ